MPDPIALVQTLYAAFARGDYPAVFACLDPAVEWSTPTTLPWSRGNYHGHAGVGDYFANFANALDDAQIVPRELFQAGDRVIGLGTEQARARSTGARFCASFAHVFSVKDDRIVRMQGIVDTAEICRAFGSR